MPANTSINAGNSADANEKSPVFGHDAMGIIGLETAFPWGMTQPSL